MLVGMNIFMMLFLFYKCGVVMGLLGVVMILVLVIGLIVIGWVIENYSWNLMFYVMFIIGLIIMFLFLKFFILV